MSTSSLRHYQSDALAAFRRGCSSFFGSPEVRADRDALAFSGKTFAAAMLAWYLALRIGLPKPYWAILTVYIVSQTSAGASFSRGVYRLCGTVVGAVATVAILPNFVNEPVICSLLLACWISLCLYLSLLDRTPRAYAFVLAGYTASLIGFPGVADPGAMFDTALVRVQEILLGIICAVLIHRFLLPRPMTGQFTGKLRVTLSDARKFAGEALRGTPSAASRRSRATLAADLLALEGLARHLPYDAAPSAPRREAISLIHDRLARLLPLASEIEDRLHMLAQAGHAMPDLIRTLVDDMAGWLASDAGASLPATGEDLTGRARLLQSRIADEAASTDDFVAANLCRHLAEMIELLGDAAGAALRSAEGGRKGIIARSKRPTGYVFHRDHRMAARVALGAATGIFGGCLLWIWSGWTDGALALSIVGVACTLFGNMDAPAPAVMRYFVGSLYAVALGLVYSFVILPRVSDFPVLVAVLAPVFLLAGSIQARPPSMLLGLGITLSFPILTNLGSAYSGDFAAFLNSSVALVIGTVFAAFSMALFQTVPVGTAVRRLVHLNRRDVARRARGHAPDEAFWTNLMIDRTALLLSRVKLAGPQSADILDETLLHLRAGHAAGRLERAASRHGDETGAELRQLLSSTAALFSQHLRADRDALMNLIVRIDIAIGHLTGSAIDERMRLIDPLIDLRFALHSATITGDGESA